MASVSEQQATQCASQPQDPYFGGLAESLEKKIAEEKKMAEQMQNTGTGSTQHAKTNTPFGVKALQGTRPNMEDAYSIQMTPPPATSSGTATATAAGAAQAGAGAEQAQTAGPGTPPTQQQNLNGPSPEAQLEEEDEANIPPVPLLPEDLAVLSVFDGHGGNEVAEHCRESLHRHFAHQLSLQRATDGDSSGDETSATWQQHKKTHYHHNIIAEALRASFLCTDQELKGTEAGDYVGATAVVAVVGKCHIIIAHAGDSRAVIQRGGKAESLTRDHKPDREDEAARIKAAGGRVVFSNGGHRVMGMLAMSRAIGDHFLRPYVIADPEVVCVERTPHDEVLVLATDGLWDVFSCKEATTLAIRCIARSKERGMSRHGACRVAASVLTKVALERGSRDNITVIVVDIAMPKQQHCHQHHHHNPHQQAAQQAQQAQYAVDAALNPLQKQQLQKQQQTHLLEQVKQQLQQQTQQEEQAAHPHATLHPPPAPATQVHEHHPLQQQQHQQQQHQEAEPQPTQGAGVGHSSSSSSSTPKVSSQQQTAGAAPPLHHHLNHHHHRQQQHPQQQQQQQHFNGDSASPAASVTPGAPATLTPTLLKPTSSDPTPPALAPATPPASSLTPTPPPTTTSSTLLPPPLAQLPPQTLLHHQQTGSQLQQQHHQQQLQQPQHLEFPPFNAANRSVSFHHPQHLQQHQHHYHHHQPHLHTMGSCSHTTSSSSLCSHTGHTSTMEQGEGHEGSACGGGAVGSKEGRGLGGKTQSFSVGTCLWLKGNHHHNLHGPHPKMDAATRAAVDRQRSAPNIQQQSQITGSCGQLQQLQQQQQQHNQVQQGQQHHVLLPPAAAPPHLSPTASAAIDAHEEQMEAADQAMSMPAAPMAPATRIRRPSARMAPGSGASLDAPPPPNPTAPQAHSPASFFEPHAYFTEHAAPAQSPSVLRPIATTLGSTNSEGGPPLSQHSAAAGAAATAGGINTLLEAAHASTCQADQKRGNNSNAAEAGIPFGGESRFRRAGSVSEPGETLVPHSGSRGTAQPTQGAFNRSRSGNGSNEQPGSGRGGIGDGRGRGKSFHGDRGGDEGGGAHALGSSSAAEGVGPTTACTAPAAPRQRQIVRRPNRPNTPTTANTTANAAAPARTAHTNTLEQQQQQQLPAHFLCAPDVAPLSSSNASSHASPAYVSRPGTPGPLLPPPVAIPPTPAPSQSTSDIELTPPYPNSAPSRHQPSPLHATTYTTAATTAADIDPHAMQYQQHQQQQQQRRRRRELRSSCSSGAIEALLRGAQGTETWCVRDRDSGALSESLQLQQLQQRQLQEQ